MDGPSCGFLCLFVLPSHSLLPSPPSRELLPLPYLPFPFLPSRLYLSQWLAHSLLSPLVFPPYCFPIKVDFHISTLLIWLNLLSISLIPFTSYLILSSRFLLPLFRSPHLSSSLLSPLLSSSSNIYHVSIIKTSDAFTSELFFIRFSAFMTSPNDLFLVPLYQRDSYVVITLQTISFFVTLCTYRPGDGSASQCLLLSRSPCLQISRVSIF